MWSQARHRMILDRLARDGRIAISDIVAETGVSRETARSDLVELEAQGIVLRRRGGAVLTDDPTARPEPNHLTRLSEALQEKEEETLAQVKDSVEAKMLRKELQVGRFETAVPFWTGDIDVGEIYRAAQLHTV